MTPPPDPSDQDAAPYREGDEVTIDLFGRTTEATIEHVYDDGGHRIRCGPALWVYLPPASTMLSFEEELDS